MANKPNKIRMLPDNWTYRDYYKFATAFRTGDTATTFDLAHKLIMQWDYTTDLKLPNAIMKLGVAESAEVVRTVMETIGNYIEALDVEPLVVNFDAWDTEKFMKFDEFRRVGNFDKAEAMVYDVVTWEGLPEKGNDFSFTQGATVYKAINEAYKRIVSGKN